MHQLKINKEKLVINTEYLFELVLINKLNFNDESLFQIDFYKQVYIDSNFSLININHSNQINENSKQFIKKILLDYKIDDDSIELCFK